MSDANPRDLHLSKSSLHLAVVIRQLALLLESGVNILRSLDVLSRQCEDPTLAYVLGEVHRLVSEGYRLSRALACFPGVFSPVCVGLVKAGETGGRLILSFNLLATSLEREASLRRQITSALAYPMIVLATAAILSMVIFQTVLPNFIEIFRSMRIPLPWITRLLIGLTNLVRNPGCILIAGSAGLAIYLLARRRLATTDGRVRAFKGLLRLPLVGGIFRCSTLARYCWVMAALLKSGVSLTASLHTAAGASGSPVLIENAEAANRSIRDGCELWVHYSHYGEIYGPLLPQMIQIGERVAGFADFYQYLGNWYNEEVEVKIEVLALSLEPILISLISILVGTVVIAVFLPLYGNLSAMGA